LQTRMVEFTHANNKKKVLLLPTNVFTVYYSDESKSTHIVSHSGTLFPALESLEEVRREIESALGGQEK
jgi:hypothetical protein